MEVKDFFNSGRNVQLVMTLADLKEFALAFAEEMKSVNEQREEQLYTPTQFAERHQVTKWRWCKSGILKPTRIGGKVFYRDSDLIK